MVDDAGVVCAGLLAEDSGHVVWLEAPTGRYSSIYDNYRLYVRCEDGRAEVFIGWDRYIARNFDHRVQYRFPPASAVTETSDPSTDGDTSFSRRPVQFIRDLVRNNRALIAKVWNYAGTEYSTGTWDIFGARGAMRLLAERCGFFL